MRSRVAHPDRRAQERSAADAGRWASESPLQVAVACYNQEGSRVLAPGPLRTATARSPQERQAGVINWRVTNEHTIYGCTECRWTVRDGFGCGGCRRSGRHFFRLQWIAAARSAAISAHEGAGLLAEWRLRSKLVGHYREPRRNRLRGRVHRRLTLGSVARQP